MTKEIYELSVTMGETWERVTRDMFLTHLALFPVVVSKEHMIGRLIGGETLTAGVLALRLSFEQPTTA